MLEGRSIVCFAHDWGGDPTSKTHIMRILSARNRVLWVNSIALRRPTFSQSDVRRLARKLRRSLGGCREEAPNLHVASPLVIPAPRSRFAERVNAAILASWLSRLCRQRGLSRPILWTFLPTVARLLGRLGEERVIYHCVDEYSAFSGVDREAIARMERELVRRSHVVLTSSEQLRDERLPYNPNTHFVPHGVDVDHFASALSPATALPEDLRALPRPVIGFFGLLADWVDFPLLRTLALAHPEWSVALVGKLAQDKGPLRDLPNVHLLGRKPYRELPAYCRGFDVGLVPFRINDLTLRANPLKVREYLAAGLPVVSTPLPEVARYGNLVRTAARHEDFIAAVERALRDRSEILDRRRSEAVRSESWEARVEQMSAIIGRSLSVLPDAGALHRRVG